MLTQHQQEKKDEIISLLKAGHKRIILQGSAGTGKTFLAGELIKYIKRSYEVNTSYNNGSVFVTAPTNKALAVIMGKVDSDVVFKTVHSALKLARWVDNKTGKEVFKRMFSKTDDFRKCKAALIDEASMLSTLIEGGYDSKEEYIKGYLEEYGFPIIYVGDNKQLSPVGEMNSPVFMKDYPVVELTEIIRQGEGNPIIDLSRDLDMIFFKTPSIIGGKGYLYDDDKSNIIEALAEVNGTDEMKYLSFTNVDVDGMNRLVREKRYGRPKKIEKLETLVFNTPHGSFYTNKEVKVIDVDVITSSVRVPNHNTKYDDMNQPINGTDTIKLKYYRINNSFDVIHEDSEKVFKAILTSIKYNCAKLGWGFRGRNFFEEQFADIKYNHAITVHKSQGSTYKQAAINIGNIMFNPQAEQRTRMLYTAVTRASDLVILNNVK